MNNVNKTLPQYVASAIVGFWRSGASADEVSEIIGITAGRVIGCIIDYRDANGIVEGSMLDLAECK